MDRRFVMRQSYAEAQRDHTAQSLLVALRLLCPRYLDRWSLSDGDDPQDFLPEGSEAAVIPVGEIWFVRACLRAQRDAGLFADPSAVDVSMRPVEVPDALLPYVGRQYARMLGRDIPDEMLDGRKWFLKDASELKRWNSALHDSGRLDHLIDADTEYVVSERVIFESEWRTFVHDDEVIACQNYLGDPMGFPDRQAIRAMVGAYASEDRPRSYTLDVGVVAEPIDGGTKTLPIEVHPFVSCGLYGMFDRLIPDMLEGGYRWYLHQSD